MKRHQRIRTLNISKYSFYISVGSFDGQLIEPLVVIDHAVSGFAFDQLKAQHSPGQAKVHHTLHCFSPVRQIHKACSRRKGIQLMHFPTSSTYILCIVIKKNLIIL